LLKSETSLRSYVGIFKDPTGSPTRKTGDARLELQQSDIDHHAYHDIYI